MNFTGEVLANIFLGNIRTWDHPDLKAINKELEKDLPPTPITVTIGRSRAVPRRSLPITFPRRVANGGRSSLVERPRFSGRSV